MRKYLLVLFLILASPIVRGESGGEIHPSPDKIYELRVKRTSEEPNLSISLKKDKENIWSKNLGPTPNDKVQVWWRPDSGAVLIDHVSNANRHTMFALLIAKDTVIQSTVPAMQLRDVKSISADSITWNKDGTVELDSITANGNKKLKLGWYCEVATDRGRSTSKPRFAGTGKPMSYAERRKMKLDKVEQEKQKAKMLEIMARKYKNSKSGTVTNQPTPSLKSPPTQ